MGGLWGAFRDGGWPNYVSLLFFMPGIALAIAAVATAFTRAGRAVGAAAVGVGALILAVGALGTWSGQRKVEAALSGASIRESQKERIRREGFIESHRCAQFGVGFAALPVLLGGVALVVATRKARGGVALPAAMLGVAGALALGDAAMAAQSPPGRDMAVDDPAWRVRDASEDLTPCIRYAVACTDGEIRRPCRQLDDALHDGADPSKVPEVDVPKLVAFCRARAPKI
jgi:hypothetical protein